MGYSPWACRELGMNEHTCRKDLPTIISYLETDQKLGAGVLMTSPQVFPSHSVSTTELNFHRSFQAHDSLVDQWPSLGWDQEGRGNLYYSGKKWINSKKQCLFGRLYLMTQLTEILLDLCSGTKVLA